MSKESFEVEMKKILEYQDIDPIELCPAFLLEAIDSLSRAEMVLAAENELGVSLSNKEIVKCKTYGEFLDLCERSSSDRIPSSSGSQEHH